MTFAATREIVTQRESLLESGYDFGFGSFFPGGLLGGLGTTARTIVQSILDNPAPSVISEVPQTWEELEEMDPELFEPILETRPGRVADSYPQDVADTTGRDLDNEDEPMAHDWGHLIRGGISEIFGLNQPTTFAPAQTNFQTEAWLQGQNAPAGGGGGGGGCDGMTWSGGAPPKGYKVVRDSCGNGVLRKVRRRRRRRMLTQGDKSDIASIVSMVGKGQLASSLINRSTS